MGGFGSAISQVFGFFSSSFIVFPPFRKYFSREKFLYTPFTFFCAHGKIKKKSKEVAYVTCDP